MLNPKVTRAVAPVIASLLMVAASVALLAIFSGFAGGLISTTSSALGAQSTLQEQVTISRLIITEATSQEYISGSKDGNVTIFVRNVGNTAITLGRVVVSGYPTNTGFRSTISTAFSGGSWSTPTGLTVTAAGGTLSKGAWISIVIVWPKTGGFTVPPNAPSAGDVLAIKATGTGGLTDVVTIVVP